MKRRAGRLCKRCGGDLRRSDDPATHPMRGARYSQFWCTACKKMRNAWRKYEQVAKIRNSMKDRTPRCPTCGRNPRRSSREPPDRVRPGACARRPSSWKCETCKKLRYGPEKYAKRPAKTVAATRRKILDQLEYERNRAKNLEEKVLDGIIRLLEDAWNDPQPWEYDDGDDPA